MQPKLDTPLLCALLLCFLTQPGPLGQPAPETLVGFSRKASAEQRALEKRFDEQIQPANFPEWMKWMSSKPHHLGSPSGKEVAKFIAGRLESWGYETRIEEFSVLFPTPKIRSLQLLGTEPFEASLEEPAVAGDATSGLRDQQLPTYNAYSRDGDVTGDLVYANFGLPADYDELATRGISVQGKIVIVRYGGSWRGVKPKVAAEHGAIGCIIYSDPKADGYVAGDVYPKGPWRPERGAQRGSVADLSQFPGDPLTPNIGATNGAKRLKLEEAPTLTKIPVLPISYADAQPFLRALAGPVAPETWRGGLPITYHLGPGPARVHLKLKFHWNQTPTFNVIGTIRGADFPEEWVIRGNHHDAWVCGANDPLSGTVTLMEEARAISELVKRGWKPRRTLIFAAWDGEEPGLIGSTEWVETHAEELKAHAVAYINGDLNTRGFLEAGGSHGLQRLVNQVAREITDPETKVSVRDRWRARILLGDSADDKRFARENRDLLIFPLGSGSDFTPFLQHLGIPSLDLRYDDERWQGVYHSIYDSFDHYSRFVNPGFVYNTTLAQTAGRVVLRLAQSDVAPFDFTALGERLGQYATEVAQLADQLRDETRQRNAGLKENLPGLLLAPGETYVPPAPQPMPPHFSFAPLQNALVHCLEETARLQGILENLPERLEAKPSPALRTLNRTISSAEQALLDAQGLPNRPWFKHMVYAPGVYTGYGVKTLPAIREALEQRRWKEVDEMILRTARTIQNFTVVITQAQQQARAVAP